MLRDSEVVRGVHIQELRELLGVSFFDILHLIGQSNPSWKVTGDAQLRPIEDPTLSLFVRLLTRRPDLSPIIQWPEVQEMYDLVEAAWQETAMEKYGPLSARRFALLFGLAAWSGNNWAKGREPLPLVRRLFRLVRDLILVDGADGLRLYLDLVDKQARVIGIPDGFQGVLQRGNWNLETKPRKISQKKETARPSEPVRREKKKSKGK